MYKTVVLSGFLAACSFSLIGCYWLQNKTNNSNLFNSVEEKQKSSLEINFFQSTKNLEHIKEIIQDLNKKLSNDKETLKIYQDFQFSLSDSEKENLKNIESLKSKLSSREKNIQHWSVLKATYIGLKKKTESARRQYENRLFKLNSKLEKQNNFLNQENKPKKVNKNISDFKEKIKKITSLISSYENTIAKSELIIKNNQGFKRNLNVTKELYEKLLKTIKNENSNLSSNISGLQKNIKSLEEELNLFKQKEQETIKLLSKLKEDLEL